MCWCTMLASLCCPGGRFTGSASWLGLLFAEWPFTGVAAVRPSILQLSTEAGEPMQGALTSLRARRGAPECG